MNANPKSSGDNCVESNAWVSDGKSTYPECNLLHAGADNYNLDYDNYGRYKFINGTTYLMIFYDQDNWAFLDWDDIPMGGYVYNVGFKSTEDEPEAENPWVDHCPHISCLPCEEPMCRDPFASTVPGEKIEWICEGRDELGMCNNWEKRENDKEGQQRLCDMGWGQFCWN